MYTGIGTKNHIQKDGNVYADDGSVEITPCFGTCGQDQIVYGKPYKVKAEDYYSHQHKG